MVFNSRRVCCVLCVCACRYAGVLSAVGIHLADVVAEVQEPAADKLAAPEAAAAAGGGSGGGGGGGGGGGSGGVPADILERQARLKAAAVQKLLDQVGEVVVGWWGGGVGGGWGWRGACEGYRAWAATSSRAPACRRRHTPHVRH